MQQLYHFLPLFVQRQALALGHSAATRSGSSKVDVDRNGRQLEQHKREPRSARSAQQDARHARQQGLTALGVILQNSTSSKQRPRSECGKQRCIQQSRWRLSASRLDDKYNTRFGTSNLTALTFVPILSYMMGVSRQLCRNSTSRFHYRDRLGIGATQEQAPFFVALLWTYFGCPPGHPSHCCPLAAPPVPPHCPGPFVFNSCSHDMAQTLRSNDFAGLRSCQSRNLAPRCR